MGKRKQTPEWLQTYGFLLKTLAGAAVLLAVIVALDLLFPDMQQQREQSVVQIDTTSGEAPRERLVTLKDGREVLCLDWDGSLTCDWENAK